MWYHLQRTLVYLVAAVGLSTIAMPAQAGWGHRWGHHHHHHYYGSYIGFGFPSYSYSSFYFSVPRARFYYPSYSVGLYSNYYVPTYSYSVALPSYYYAPTTYYVAPTYYTAPIVYPSCCDPCASVTTPSVSYPSSSPIYAQPEYSTGVDRPYVDASSQVASTTGGSFVDRMLGRSATAPVPLRASVSQFAGNKASDGSIRTVSTLKPVTPDVSVPANIDQLTPIPATLLKTADDMFALGGYEQAASAYARLAVRFGNHDALAVRRFIALVACGDHAQASIVYELAIANGRPLTVNALPGGLAELYGASAGNRKNHIESLAAYALKSESEALPLYMVGTWLELDGQSQRAQTFLKRAEMISEPASPNAPATLANRLVDTLLAR